MKKAQHSVEWPWPVEVQHKSDVVHASLASEADQRTLLDMVGKAGSKTPTTPRVRECMYACCVWSNVYVFGIFGIIVFLLQWHIINAYLLVFVYIYFYF